MGTATMTKKKPEGKKPSYSGKHTTPRRTVQLPRDLVDLLEEVATEENRPVTWHLAALIREHLREKGKLPPEGEG